MGKRGPAPKPTNLRLLHGETRPSRINANEPIPRDALPQCPDDVTDEVRAIWDYTVAELVSMRTVTAADRDALLCYCEAVAAHRRASALLAKSEVLIKGRHNHPVRNPACQIQRDAAQMVRAFAQEFGLTPSARSQITMPEQTQGRGAERLLS